MWETTCIILLLIASSEVHIDLLEELKRACYSVTAGSEGKMLAVTKFRPRFELLVWGGTCSRLNI